MKAYFLTVFYVALTTTSNVKGLDINCSNAVDDFKTFRLCPKLTHPFIDKSLLIKEIFGNSDEAHTIISRPPKFGKTVNLRMLERFAKIPDDDEEAEFNRKLFLGGEIKFPLSTRTIDKLKIADSKNIVTNHLGKHPVVYLDFKDCGFSNFFHAINSLHKRIKNYINANEYLMNDFTDITRVKKLTLESLTKHVRKHYKKKVVLLLDNYDSAINNAYLLHGPESSEFTNIYIYYKEFFEYNILFNGNIEKAIITTVIPITHSRYETGVYSVMDEKFSEYYGFNDNELDHLLNEYKPDRSTKEEIKNYYKGYSINGQTIYNPGSIFNCLENKGALAPNPASMENLKILDLIPITSSIVGELDHFVRDGKDETVYMSKHFSYNKFETTNVLAYLVFTGYLHAMPMKQISHQHIAYDRSALNPETKVLLQRKIIEWINTKLQLSSKDLLGYLTQFSIHDFNQQLQEILKKAADHRLYSGLQDYYVDMLEGFVTNNVNCQRFHHVDPIFNEKRLDIIFVQTTGKGSVVGIVLAIQLAKNNNTNTLSATAVRGLQEITKLAYENKLKQMNPKLEYIFKLSISFCDGAFSTKSQISKADEIVPITEGKTDARLDDSTKYREIHTDSTKRRQIHIGSTLDVAFHDTEYFKMFINSKLPVISDASLRFLEEQLQGSKENRIIFKEFLKSKGVMKDFKQTIYTMWASVIHPDIHIVKRSLGVKGAVNGVDDFPRNYRHIIEAVVEVVHQVHNDTGILTLLNAVQEILEKSDVIPVIKETPPIRRNSTATRTVEVTLITKKPSYPDKQVVGSIKKWINKFKEAFSNGTKHFKHKLKVLLRGTEVTPSKPVQSSESSSEYDSEFD